MLRPLHTVPSKTCAFARAVLADEPAPFGAPALKEKEVLSFFIDHHTMAIELATLGAKKAVHADLKVLCGEMIERLRNERDSLHDWFERWYAQDHEPEVSEVDMSVLESVAALSGEVFEVAIMKELIRHQATARAQGAENTRKSYHIELQQLSRNGVSIWTRDIGIMQQWLCRRYQVGE